MSYKMHEKIDGWKVCQFIYTDSIFHGKWYAARDPGKTWCDIRGGFYTDHDYIHSDGIARKSLKNGELWSGYFTTKEAVVAAINLYNSRSTMSKKVIIDGIEYAPVSESNPNAKQIATALIERYMGKFDESEWEELAHSLQVYVSEEMNQPTVMQTVAEILAATNNPS